PISSSLCPWRSRRRFSTEARRYRVDEPTKPERLSRPSYPPGHDRTSPPLGTRAIGMATRDDSPSIGIDLDGTIDEAPEFFRILTNLWPGRIYVITYRDDYARAVADVQLHGVKYDQVVLVNSFREKAVRIAELGISVYFDDMDEMLMHIPEGV